MFSPSKNHIKAFPLSHVQPTHPSTFTHEHSKLFVFTMMTQINFTISTTETKHILLIHLFPSRMFNRKFQFHYHPKLFILPLLPFFSLTAVNFSLSIRVVFSFGENPEALNKLTECRPFSGWDRFFEGRQWIMSLLQDKFFSSVLEAQKNDTSQRNSIYFSLCRPLIFIYEKG